MGQAKLPNVVGVTMQYIFRMNAVILAACVY